MFFRKRADTTNTTVIQLPAPKVVQPTLVFDGNDGKWSTFFINIGGDGSHTSVGQNFRLLPSTSFPITLVPGQASWCDSDCAKSRGVEILASQNPLGFKPTSTWQEKGLFGIDVAEDLRLYPDAKPNGTWGTDRVGIGQAGSLSYVLEQQWVVQSTSPDFYVGYFGLGNVPVNTGGETRAPFLVNFQNSSQTPTVSYGYSAGAYYQNNSKGVPGSLILGGFDQSRFLNQNITVPFANPGNTSLIVGVDSIIYRPDPDVDTNSSSLTSGSNSQFLATIDSTLPYLWLPDDICDRFAEEFQLSYDKTRNMYTVSDSAHTTNQRTNATVMFMLNPGVSSSGSITITLPYNAFDLEASEPIFSNSTRYFPIKRSPTGIFVLGRTLLQEAYLIVDYDRNQFQVAPAIYSDPMPDQHIVPILPDGYTPPINSSAPNANNPSGGGGGLSGGAIAGIVVGILALVLIAGVGFFFWWKKKRQQKRLSEKADPQEIDTTAAGGEVKHRRVSELDSEPPNSPKPSMGGYYGKEGKDTSPFPTINEMESPPAELYSPPPPGGDTPRSERSERDYFTNSKPRRRGATRESSGNNTPGTPGVIHELPGDDGEFQVEGQHFERVPSPIQNSPAHSRGPSDTSLNTNIDQVIADSREPSQAPPDRRPSMHHRGPSDAPTIQSDSTAVSDPTPEERERWAAEENGPGRPLSE